MTSQKKKNILLISMDDAVSFWRYKEIFGIKLETPNLDEICAVSTAFHSAYCQSPLCGPSRASFMSGRTPPETGVLDNKTNIFDRVPAKEMWQVRLKQDGYFCSSGGKVHHGFKPLSQDVHDLLYSDHRKGYRIDLKLKPKYRQSRNGGSGGGISTLDPKDDGYYHDAQSAKSFTEFLETYDGDAPFYREVGFFSPHSPFITPIRFKEMYPLKDFEYPPSWEDGFERSIYSDKYIKKNFGTHKKRHWAKSVRNYFSAFSHGDHHLGNVWRALKNSRFADSTIVVLLTDHGFHLGEANRFGKSTLWEQSALVPFIIHDPSKPKARVIREPVALLDVGPTILDYAEVGPIDHCVGKSLRGVVSGRKASAQRAVPTFNPHGSSIRQGQYRFIRYKDGSTEFYNVETDWWQQKMLGSDHPDFQRVSKLHDKCCLEYGFDLKKSITQERHG